MSLEDRIAALTVALEANTAALLGAKPAATAHAAERKAKPIIGADQAVINSAPLLNKGVTVAPAPPVDAAPPAYDDVKVPFLKLVKTKRDAALAILKEFGLATLLEAKPEQLAPILAAINKASA